MLKFEQGCIDGPAFSYVKQRFRASDYPTATEHPGRIRYDRHCVKLETQVPDGLDH
jgi:hypothetical protein